MSPTTRGRCSPVGHSHASWATTSTATTSPARRWTRARRHCSSSGRFRMTCHRWSCATYVARSGWFAAGVHGHPATKLRTIGITGTNGKTTTSYLVAAILRAAGVETRCRARCPAFARLRRRPTCNGCSRGTSPTVWRRWSWRSRRTRSPCIASPAWCSTSPCSPTSDAITSICTSRWRPTSAPRRRCSPARRADGA